METEYLPSVSVSSFSAYFVWSLGHSEGMVGLAFPATSLVGGRILASLTRVLLPLHGKGRRSMKQTCSPFNQIFPWPWSGAFVGGSRAISDRSKSIMKAILMRVEPVHRLIWEFDIFASEVESKRRLNWRETLHSIFRLLNFTSYFQSRVRPAL